MKKLAATVVSIGVVLVIVGLIMVGIYGGEAIRNTSWKDIFNGTNHNLNNANAHKDKSEEELIGLKTIDIKAQRYSVYVLPSEENVMSVKYVDPSEDGVSIDVDFVDDTLTITETDSLTSHFWSAFKSNRFVAVYLPQTELFTNSFLDVTVETAGISVKDVAAAHVKLVAHTGGVSVNNCKTEDIDVNSDTGAVNVNNLICDRLNVDTNTGAVNVTETTAAEYVNIEVDTGAINCNVTCGRLKLATDTGAVNFNVNANDITVKTDTGSVNGTIIGDKSNYQISVSKGTGKTNIQSQMLANATKFLTVEVDTGTINIDFVQNH